MSHDDAPPVEAIVALVAMLAAWPLVMRVLWSYSFSSDYVRIYLFGIAIAQVHVDEIEGIRIVSLFDILSGSVPYPPQRWKMRMYINSFFRKVMVLKTKEGYYWCMTPKSADTVVESLQLRVSQRRERTVAG